MRIGRIAAALGALALPAALARAQAEGIAEMKGAIHTERGDSIGLQTKAWVGKAGSRVEMTTDLSQMASRSDRSAAGMPATHTEVLLYRNAEPGTTYMLNVERKTYSVLQAASGEKSETTAGEPYAVTKLGRDSVAGYSCEKALVKRASARDEMEVCVSKDLGTSGAWIDAMSRRQRSGSVFKALSDAGLRGFPVRWIVRHAGEKEATTTLELTRFEKTSVPASTFEIPAGYKKVSGYETRMTPEQEEAMRKAMENMTPEQRKQFEEMLKKQKENQ
jgi:hypothetical protein